MKIASTAFAILMFALNGIQKPEAQYPVSFVTQRTVEAVAGSLLQVSVAYSIEYSWYIYAPTGNNASQGMIETNVIFNLPKGFTREGKLQIPKHKYKGGFEIYEGSDIKMLQQFKVDKSVPPGEYIIKAKITYQACNDKICLPPKSEEVDIKVILKDNRDG